jgi:hypothetical protein
MEQHPHESPRSEEGNDKPPTRSEPGQWPREQREESAQAGRPAALPTGSTGSGRPDPGPAADAPTPVKRIGWIEGHMPEIVDPLDPKDPETSFTQTRALRHDGWTPERRRRFLERMAECGVIVEACEAAGMSARSAYNLRDRDPLFAAGWDAANVKARAPLSDEAYSRARNGVVERIYKDGVVVAERHRYDNRLTMAVLARLDARIDRAEEKGAAHLNLVARWDEYLDALGDDRREDGMALLAGPEAAPQAEVQENAGHRELHELHPPEEEETEPYDKHMVWESDGSWWTDYPPPEDFEGEEHGAYGDFRYRRSLTREEQAVIDAEEAEELAEAEAQRDAWFGFSPDAPDEEGEGAPRPEGEREEESDADGP